MGEQIKVTMEQMATAVGGMAARFFAKTDANKDKRVSLAEMQQIALAQFDRIDLNHDGTITPAGTPAGAASHDCEGQGEVSPR